MIRYTVCGGDEDFSPDSSYRCLFFPQNEDYALFYSEDATIPPSLEPVTRGLCDLVESAKSYPPAIALTRRDISQLTFEAVGDFLVAVHSRLLHYLTAQRSDGFVLASGKARSGREFTLNHFYWIVDLSDGVATWVTEDYVLSECPVEEFKDFESIAAHFGSKRTCLTAEVALGG